MQIIGFLGRDAVVQQHGTEAVLNFSVAHTDKYLSGGQKMERTTWISCSWWTEKHTIAQYLKKGTQVWIEGNPEAKMWTGKDGQKQCGLVCRVRSLQLLGNSKRDSAPAAPSQSAPAPSDGYKPVEIPREDEDFSDLPF